MLNSVYKDDSDELTCRFKLNFLIHVSWCVSKNTNKAIRDGKYLAMPHSSAWQRSPIKIENILLGSLPTDEA